MGIADGARSNWDFLGLHVEEQILDFYQAREYLTQAADALFDDGAPHERHAWLEAHDKLLKEDWDGAVKIAKEWEAVNQQGWNKQRR